MPAMVKDRKTIGFLGAGRLAVTAQAERAKTVVLIYRTFVMSVDHPTNPGVAQKSHQSRVRERMSTPYRQSRRSLAVEAVSAIGVALARDLGF